VALLAEAARKVWRVAHVVHLGLRLGWWVLLRLVTVAASSLREHKQAVSCVIGIVLLKCIVLLLLTEALAIEIGLNVRISGSRCRWLRHGKLSVDSALACAGLHSGSVEVEGARSGATALDSVEDCLRVGARLREHRPSTARSQTSPKRGLVGSRETATKVVVVAEVVVGRPCRAGQHCRAKRT